MVNRERVERRVLRRLEAMPLGMRRELLELLVSRPEVRADVIRQVHGRPESRDLAELLIDLEAEPALRLDAARLLKESVRKGEGR